ncbi:MAG: hypothetical protein DRJ03_30760 [Chloroflexi bacterium]|nr:MAG: hypothetical protein DRJ03_30760 [Chloroflexota bacterium]
MTVIRGKTWYDVQPSNGVYLVTEMTRGRLRVFVVGKDKSCTCGGSANEQCRHIEAVAEHLRLGGQRAPEKWSEPSPPSTPSIPRACPICGATTVRDGFLWRCLEDSSHYWQWRGEQSGVKDFLTRPHPAKQGAFYEQSDQERQAFLAASAQRHAAYVASAMTA